MTLHELLDINYGADGDDKLRQLLAGGAPINAVDGPQRETPLQNGAKMPDSEHRAIDGRR